LCGNCAKERIIEERIAVWVGGLLESKPSRRRSLKDKKVSTIKKTDIRSPRSGVYSMGLYAKRGSRLGTVNLTTAKGRVPFLAARRTMRGRISGARER